MDKAALRAELKAVRSGLVKDFTAEASQAIAVRCMEAVDGRVFRRVHIYQANLAWHEVDTTPLIELIAQTYPECEIVYPLADKGTELPAGEFDLVVVPTLGFDSDRYRIGLGAGWYDRFLVTQPGAFKVGVAFEAGFVGHLPREAHDVQLDMIVTEERTIR